MQCIHTMEYYGNFKMDELDPHKMTQRDIHKVLWSVTKEDTGKCI